ncbi:hypothetical protein GYMLUDRAFT_247593 [Collybiopsis luxurians FD-317 M1]|uniref:Uncharacterized protein n=1 Tax=Collybiopsis luxurians FD-317 M1 TaxID=944289 RepID=A0A0D0CNG5_9AGAR|nr:hypothetical protein GYMLUDRAFT_247593 [Collybiopsis luxurians FD-317 M1]
MAKKMRCVAFECSMHLNYPSISITDHVLSSLPTGLQSIYEDAYLANSTPEGKEVICDPVDVDVEMEAPEELDAMNLDYPEEVPPPPVPVSGLKTWFFKPLIKQVPSDDSSPTWDKMIQTAIERIVLRISALVSGPGKMMLEQDLWALADGIVQGAFDDLEEQLNHSSSQPPIPFSKASFLQFLKRIKAENLQLKEQVSLRDSQLKEKDKELTCLKSFVRHFKGDIQLLETQQLRETLEGRESEIESLKAKLAAIQGQFVAASPLKPSSSSF